MCRTQKEFTDWNRGNKGVKAHNEVWETGRSLIIWVVKSALFNFLHMGCWAINCWPPVYGKKKSCPDVSQLCHLKQFWLSLYIHMQTHTQLSRLSQWEKVCAALQLCSDGNSFRYIKNVYLVVRELGGRVIVWSNSLFNMISVITIRSEGEEIAEEICQNQCLGKRWQWPGPGWWPWKWKISGQVMIDLKIEFTGCSHGLG